MLLDPSQLGRLLDEPSTSSPKRPPKETKKETTTKRKAPAKAKEGAKKQKKDEEKETGEESESVDFGSDTDFFVLTEDLDKGDPSDSSSSSS